MLTWKDLAGYLHILIEWWAVLALATVLAMGSAWFLTYRQPDYYQARSSLQIGNGFTVSNPSRSALEVNGFLARYYEVLIHREVILQPVVDRLDLPISWQDLDELVATEINPDANLLEITITDTNPQRAAAIAYTIGEQLIAYSPNAPEKVAAEQAEIARQINEAQERLQRIERQIGELRERQSAFNSPTELRESQDQIDDLESTRSRYQDRFNRLIDLQNSNTISTVSFLERASVPTRALPKKTALIVGGAGLGGLVLGILAVILLDLLDDTWRSGRDLQRRFGLRHLGAISPRSLSAGGFGTAALRTQRGDPTVRETHTQLVLAASEQQPRVLLVSGPRPSRLRSAYSLDLAGIYGQYGHRVLLVDAELAIPAVTTLVAAPESPAATAAQSLGASWPDPERPDQQVPLELWVKLRPTPLANVALLPSSRTAELPQPALAPLLRWSELIAELRQVADVVILDGPSALTGADIAVLAPLVDGVVLVLEQDRHSRREIAETKARVEHSSQARLLGVVTVAGEDGAKGLVRGLKPLWGPIERLIGRFRRLSTNSFNPLSQRVRPGDGPAHKSRRGRT